ncbi:MAG: TonB-dependent receptor [Chitinophagales bacterium]|nr:TonB-dependent receptor [Bacteroidota bacterium]MCB9043043.1 TonB-dependent receptor [Chitinophagales bacterium]
MKTRFFLSLNIISSFLFLPSLFAQNLEGTIVEIDEQAHEVPLWGANVYWQNTTLGTISDSLGNFSLSKIKNTNTLIVSYIGYKTDTLKVASNQTTIKIVMKSQRNLDEIEITADYNATHISMLESAKVETITGKEFRRAACCNLSESFETNPSIDVNFADAVTGAKELRMLGLDGAYIQILGENIPALRGLSATYGMEYIPGSWMNAIQLTKGAGSVINGYESISGQINIDYIKPFDAPKFFANVYVNEAGRTELNLNFAQKINKHWAGMLMTHGNLLTTKHDKNGDNFVDMPLRKNVMLFNRWDYRSKHIEGQWGVKYINDQRTGGELDFDRNQIRNTENPYGFGFDTERFEIFSKTGYVFDKPNTSVGLQVSWQWHEQNSFFGIRDYDAKQQSLYANLIYTTDTGLGKHKFTAGASYILDKYREALAENAASSQTFLRDESVPGIFGEYNYAPNVRFSMIVGLRLDAHNLYGTQLSPRLHVRYKLGQRSAWRISAGRGFRRANPFAENTNLLLSNRPFVFQNLNLPAEFAWNYGTNFTQNFTLWQREASFSIDAYQTLLKNQTLVDTYSDASTIWIIAAPKSIANYFQAQLDYKLLHDFDVRLAYKYESLTTSYLGIENVNVPFIPQHKGLINLTYKSHNEHWQVNWTSQLIGTQNLAIAADNGENQLTKAPAYNLHNAQVNYVFKSGEIYLGAENLFNFKQENPIQNWETPFAANFDASNTWGPIFGRMTYIGVKWTLK